jgi:hypothetical protein
MVADEYRVWVWRPQISASRFGLVKSPPLMAEKKYPRTKILDFELNPDGRKKSTRAGKKQKF